jgi:predicted MFS family arabinose efflux permease
VRESRDPQPRRIDWAGQTVLTGGLFLLVLALLRGNDVGWGSTQIVAELSGAAVLLALFALIETRVKDPMLPLGFFRIPSFTGAQIAAFSISASLFAVYIYATIYLQQVLGLSPIEAGLAYLPGTIINAATSGVTAGMAEKGKLSPRVAVSLGLALVAAGLLLMTAADANSSWLAIQPGLLIAMIGTGMFNPAVIAVALGSVSQEQSGLAAGVNDTARQAGIAVGVAALGALIPTGALAHGDVTSYVGGLHDALLVGGALAALGALAAAYLIRPVLQARRESKPAIEVSEVALEPCA